MTSVVQMFSIFMSGQFELWNKWAYFDKAELYLAEGS